MVLQASPRAHSLSHPRRGHELCQKLERKDCSNILQQLARVIGKASIWTFLDLECRQISCQVGRNGGGRVLAKIGSKYVRQIIPNKKEHITILTCINSNGDYISNMYIFKGKQQKDEYIRKCEPGAVYAMQKKAWMSGYIFYKWLDHLFRNPELRGGISQIKRHLLILDGHGSYVILDVILKAREHGLDLLILPSHTSHAL